MDNDNNRNLIIFMVCAALILIVYQVTYMGPHSKAVLAERAAAAAAAAHAPPPPTSAAAQDFGLRVPSAAAPHVAIDTPSLKGEIDVQDGRIDDLWLKHYRVSTDPHSDLVHLLRPAGGEHAWFMETGWQSAGDASLPGDTDRGDNRISWTVAQPGAVLTPTTPLILTYDNSRGLKATRTVQVDDNALFTITDVISNATAQPLALRDYGLVENQGQPADPTKSGIVHEGAIAVLQSNGAVGVSKFSSMSAKFQNWKKKVPADQPSTGGWIGTTQKYWLAALIPDQSLPMTASFPVETENGVDVYRSGFVGQVETIAPGKSLIRTTRMFAGAKTVPVLRAYSAKLHVPQLDQAVDWGILWFFTIPLFAVLEFLKSFIGNMGLSILALTVVVKLAFFPLANKSFESMSKMKKLAPQLEALKKQHEGDAPKIQQETMALYQREKINPFMGCIPMLIQIPVFYSLLKVLTVTIEMRQAPFFGWIHDLAAPDPKTIWNLFGALPYDPSHWALVGPIFATSLHLGVWPILYGLTMWLSQAMSPPAGVDPTQKLMFQVMPLIFTFVMAGYAVGLLIYWTWSNLLSILQQYLIMHRLKVENPIDNLFARLSHREPVG